MDKGFLNNVNLELLQRETGKSIQEIAELIGLKNPVGIYKWAKSQDDYGTRPSYNAIYRLLKAGATTESLFGIEVKAKEPEATQDQILAQVKKALSDLIQK